ncbi:MAG TPA: hypothetical protein VMB03_06595 [Bryobacteraceae bacterium]|nr:hypothetical protein [Bryobacteraceae bacterium]
MDPNPAENPTASEKPQGCFVCETAMPLVERFLGGPAIEHFRNSRIEFLKAVRSLLDERIAQLSRQADNKGTHVTVE